MIVVALLGLGLGMGVLGLVAVARRRADPLTDVVVVADPAPAAAGHLRSAPVERVHVAHPPGRPDLAAGVVLARALRGTPVARRLDADLFATERTLEGLCAESVLAGGIGIVLPALVLALMATGGVHAPIAVGALGAVALATAGSVLPVVALNREAGRARVADRRALGSFLDLVVLCLASGMGLEGALDASSDITDQRLVKRVRRGLAVARGSGHPPWAALEEIGRRGRLPELQELAAALGLAGREGARVRATLVAKAASIRRRELADAESAANRATERLFLPGVLLLFGFLLFIGYPAMARIAIGF
jgi:hypothetical protein